MNELIKFLKDELKYWQGIAYQERQRAERFKEESERVKEEIERLREYIRNSKMM